MRNITPKRIAYRYEPSYRLAENLNRLPKKVKRFAIEGAAIALLSFMLSIILASQSDSLKDFRAYFLMTARDCATIGVVSIALHRLLTGNEKD